MKKSTKIAAAFALVLLAVGAALDQVSQMLAVFAITVPAASHPNLTPASLGLPFEAVGVVSSDGYHLRGWWVPPPAGAPPKTPVVVIHGLGAGKEFMLGYASFLHAEGRGALLIDLRGHGESDPSPTTLGEREPLDVKAWLDWFGSRGLAKPVLWGTSLGAVTAIRAGAENNDRIAGVIADAPFDTLRHTLAVHARLYFNLPEFPLVELTAWQIGRRLGFDVDSVDNLRTVTEIHVPILVLAAERDHRMTPESVRRIFDRANEPKRFYLIPGDDHETRHFAPEFRREVAAFLDSCDQAGAAAGTGSVGHGAVGGAGAGIEGGAAAAGR